MKHATLRRLVAALLLGVALTTPAAWAAEARAGQVVDRTARTPKALVLRVWSELVALWDREGSYIDPFGVRATSPEPTPSGGSHLKELTPAADLSRAK